MRPHGFGRIITTIVSGIAILGSFLAILIFSLHDLGAARLNSDIRIYQGSFYSEGALLYETGPLKKGDLIGYSEMPTKEKDADGSVYQFIGWDIDNNGIPDIIGDRIYFNFVADAVFYKLPIPEDFTLTEEQLENLLNLLTHLNLELTPEQIQMILDILMDMNIDWTDIDQDLLMRILDFLGMDLEDFMNMLGLDMESLIGLLNAPVLSYTASDYSLPVFFRTQSFGDYSNAKWVKGDYYAASNISEGSVNPLCYAMDKIANVMSPTTFNITYLKNGKYYPVPAYELNNTQGLNSESHSLESPADAPTEEYPKAKSYQTTGYGFYPASAYTILMANKDGAYTNPAIEADELKYREYAYSHYLNVDNKYKEYFTQLAAEEGFEKDQFYNFTSKINEYFKSFTLYELNLDEMKSYPSGVDKVMYFMQEAKAGLSEHFATATTLLYRSLGVPARYVEGYFDYPDGTEPRVIGGLYAHSWVEIYVDHLGWMMVDTSVSNVIPPELSNLLFGAPNVAFDTFEKRTLDHIEAEVTKTRYFTGSEFNKQDLTITAHYTNGMTQEIDVAIEDKTDTTTQSLTIYVPEFNEEGTKVIKIIYVENGVPSVAKINIEVVDARIESMVVDPGSYQDVYLKDNKINIDNITFTATYNDGEKETLHASAMNMPTIKTDTVGHFDYVAKLKTDETVTATISINVLSEPVAALSTLRSKTEKYSVFLNQPLQATTLNLEAVYADNTYRKVDTSTGTIELGGGNYTQVGTTSVTVRYAERGNHVDIVVPVEVKRFTENIAFYFNLVKTYDGEAFNFDECLHMVDINNRGDDLLSAGHSFEVEFTSQPVVAADEFIDAGTIPFGIRFRIVDSNGNGVTDEYLENATEIMVLLNEDIEGDANSAEEDSKAFTRDGDYVNIGILQFTIEQREISFTTATMAIDPTEQRYISDGNGGWTTLFDSSVYLTITSGTLVSGDEIDYSSIVFNKTYSQAPYLDDYTDNTINKNNFIIYNSARGKDVTKNYYIDWNWGGLSKLY